MKLRHCENFKLVSRVWITPSVPVPTTLLLVVDAIDTNISLAIIVVAHIVATISFVVVAIGVVVLVDVAPATVFTASVMFGASFVVVS